jgi:hypothetical protein
MGKYQNHLPPAQYPSDINLDPRVKLRAGKLLREHSKGLPSSGFPRPV